ncbi:bifunctional TVP38/TMEM64 family protein/FAD-dependent oxidoreductase [Marinobacterium maritimum]|uniref:Bifunctional TVP38/TMEM64 family protein/FAD-dependent oxidoreductase n=1 Tax=Marinobacterium maritimum TaxID=500162 RepID=A0ABN1I1B2_9GAMM
MKKLLILAVIAAVAIAFFILDLHHWLTLDGLKSGLEQFEYWRSQAPLLTAGGFFLLYIIVTALSLPGAAVMTLAGGALFGLGQGLLLVSFASTIGATLAFLVSRYLLQNWVQSRFGNRLDAINRGIERDGAFYLFTLRLVPAFPFFLINLLMGLTPIRAWTFYWVSQVGMLAGTLVYVNAGTQIAQLESLSGILSPDLLISFALLGLFPLLAKKLIGWIQRRRVYGRWQKPARFDRNLIVIGAGAGGLVSAYIAAAVKAKVTLVEAHKMGGDCLNYGCVPSKALIKSARVAHQMRQAERYGLDVTAPRFSFRAVMARIQTVIHKVEPHDSIERYTGLGVEVLQGHATLIDPWTVEIRLHEGETRRLTARSIILATGASPVVPPLPGLDETGYVTSDTLWDKFAERDTPPEHLVVLGGGPIGCELSQCFARLGSKVTQVVRGERLMTREDTEVAELVQASLQDEGVDVLTNHATLRAKQRDGCNYLICDHQGQEVELPFDELLIAVGRQPRLTGYGLETLGIETHRTLTTNAYLETLYPNIYAVGDVAGPYQFTHTAAHQAWYAAVNALFGQFKRFRADYRVIPWTTFTDPEVARVGLSEQEAIERGVAHEITRYALDELDRAITESEPKGFVKVLTEPGKDRILGACIVGEHAGELLAEFVLAMKHGLGLNKILGTIHTYPTWAEANKYAAGEWKKAHAPEAALKWLERYHAWRRG